MAFGTVALLGSGETAPGMTKVHRQLFSCLDDVRGVNLNTPYGFQENVDQMTEKILSYFDVSLHVALEGLDLRSFADATPDQRSRFKESVAASPYVFAGPGSPSYALTQWRELALADDLSTVLAAGGVVCFSSAAALTLGAKTIPVYEMYKAGAAPSWLDGLDVLGRFGLHCAVVPHYNNAEGGTYDTSRCYVGERRLQELEQLLDEGQGILGIDEHTAALIDFDTRTLSVLGKGDVHWRHGGQIARFETGTVVSLDELGAEAVQIAPVERPEVASAPVVDADAWAQRDARDQKLVGTLDAIRAEVRAQGNYAIADALRDALNAFGVTVQDGARAPKA